MRCPRPRSRRRAEAALWRGAKAEAGGMGGRESGERMRAVAPLPPLKRYNFDTLRRQITEICRNCDNWETEAGKGDRIAGERQVLDFQFFFMSAIGL